MLMRRFSTIFSNPPTPVWRRDDLEDGNPNDTITHIALRNVAMIEALLAAALMAQVSSSIATGFGLVAYAAFVLVAASGFLGSMWLLTDDDDSGSSLGAFAVVAVCVGMMFGLLIGGLTSLNPGTVLLAAAVVVTGHAVVDLYAAVGSLGDANIAPRSLVFAKVVTTILLLVMLTYFIGHSWHWAVEAALALVVAVWARYCLVLTGNVKYDGRVVFDTASWMCAYPVYIILWRRLA
jgi:hypothetical protein